VEITWRCHGSGPPAPGWSAPSLCGWLAVGIPSRTAACA